MVIQICIGSACHLRGSYDLIEQLKSFIAEDKLEDKITLKASFCLGHCGEHVTMKVNGEFLDGVTPANVKDIYINTLKPAALGE